MFFLHSAYNPCTIRVQSVYNPCTIRVRSVYNPRTSAYGALGPHVATVKNPKMSCKLRTDLKICPSKAKNLEELDFDVRKNLAPRKSTENNGKSKKKNKKNSDFFFSTSKNRNLQIFRNARCRSFAAIGAKFEG